ncbi:hypothetical protein BTP_3415 [Burkholderia thailandensis Phuket 4W-1]|nr:hypothetical protein BTQ_3992 [Burkholderia thailandensis 2002721723]AIP28914.1 hypothetical protein DR63_5069 [Burkholderia thailandensis E264]AJY01563.1 hypothetical protein BG87_3447 [Burkholderia thailandensis 2002721643]AVR06663.1 hypothetical protein A8H31_03310 [Burkholderia thailandensis]KIS55166.1 hypothetical protein BTP_3415 [Burkholderia thailandensis Phuket 4W-1]
MSRTSVSLGAHGAWLDEASARGCGSRRGLRGGGPASGVVGVDASNVRCVTCGARWARGTLSPPPGDARFMHGAA